jgi:hypothetical protein
VLYRNKACRNNTRKIDIPEAKFTQRRRMEKQPGER